MSDVRHSSESLNRNIRGAQNLDWFAYLVTQIHKAFSRIVGRLNNDPHEALPPYVEIGSNNL
jgi:hypothetical protein